MADSASDKSQEATPHRRQQARDEGQVAHSQDFAAAGMLVVGLVALLIAGGGAVKYFIVLAQRQLGGEAWLEADVQFATNQWQLLAIEVSQVLAPVFAVLVVAAVLLHVGQTGLLWVPQQLMPDGSRINPLAGFGRLFSLSSAVRLTMGLFKVAIVSAVAFWSLWHRREEILAAAGLDVPQIGAFILDITLWTSLKIALALLILAALDYFYQRWKHEQDLRMTPQEVREEMKNLQGDPQIIARRRQVQRQLALHRLSSAVPKADVVVTNPTELAIAIQYNPQTMNAPIVVAKGAGALAARIRKLALENGIPVIEKKPLAQALYKDVEINRPIPDAQYAAVAELLAYVYQLKGKKIPGRAA